MKRYLAILAIVSLFILAGCQQQEQGPDLSAAYIGGTQGLAISFPQGMPPAEIYDEGQMTFSVGVMLENVGESGIGLDTPNAFGFVELIGINPDNFNKVSQSDLSVSWDEAQISLEPARRGFDGSVIPGSESLVQLNDLSYTPDLHGNQEVTVRANVCYEYRTYARGEICIKDNVLENAQDDTICTLSGAKPLSTSGAPVQVTQLTQNPAGSDRIQVTFTIENIGAGSVFAPPNQAGGRFGELCVSNAGPNSLRDVVEVEVSVGEEASSQYNVRCPLLGGADFGAVRMFGGAPTVISCTLETFGGESDRIFTENLNVDLHYTYFDYIEKPLIIRDTNVGFRERDQQ